MALFGLNAKGMPKVDLRHPCLPFFLCASLETGKGIGEVSQVQTNVSRVLTALQVEGSRNFVLTFDDSVYWPSYNMLLLPEPTVVGGSGNLSLIPLPENADESAMNGLEKQMLAQTALSYCISRADSNKHVYDIRMIPRRLKEMNAKKSLQELGCMWREATLANRGVPPLAQSCDNHQSQVLHNTLFLGGMSQEMVDFPFLEWRIMKKLLPNWLCSDEDKQQPQQHWIFI